MIRSDVKVLDCTIRDGGAVNNSHFDDRTVRAVYDACADAGIDYMEIGYKNDEKFFDPQKFGKWRFWTNHFACVSSSRYLQLISFAYSLKLIISCCAPIQRSDKALSNIS